MTNLQQLQRAKQEITQEIRTDFRAIKKEIAKEVSTVKMMSAAASIVGIGVAVFNGYDFENHHIVPNFWSVTGVAISVLFRDAYVFFSNVEHIDDIAIRTIERIGEFSLEQQYDLFSRVSIEEALQGTWVLKPFLKFY